MHQPGNVRHEWILRRNCSLTPRQLLLAYGLLCGFSLLVSMAFAVHGAWQILIYTASETGLVAWAFLTYCRHVNDRDRIVLTRGWMTIEQVRAEEVRRIELSTCWIRIDVPKRPRDLIRFESHGKRFEVGQLVTESRRRQVAQEIRGAILEAGREDEDKCFV